ncbi:hypothetical protein ATL39_0140 [Sinobaca qinghaiensis]|uniref:Sporulation protein Cse60 n=1 Tax=Sinobaca qinghaiensis TaxID=342944 RepID=A0A419V7B1_9BACL|nr:hypothetical protein [Sinobaca qinghaiensis]RKD75930.1 hypothetical protein ATL39_0140 [Sinobaca qinghaiensis]
MNVKTFYAWSEKKLDERINYFLQQESTEIIDIKFASPLLYFSAMVIYIEKDGSHPSSFGFQNRRQSQ